MRASILIVNFNAKDKLLLCLRSVMATLGAEDEIIIVDNASEDGSGEAIAMHFPHALLIRSPHNVGFAAGNNLGAQKASGEYLVFLNPDTFVRVGWLDALLKALQSKSDVGVVTAKIVLPDGRINACGNRVHFTGITLCHGWGQSASAFDHSLEVDAVSGAAFALRRELFKELGGFDEDMFLYMEDTDLSWRVRLRGWRCLCVPASIVEHDYALRFSPHKVFYQERNRYVMLLKNLRWPTLFIMIPSLLLTEIVTWGFVLFQDRSHGMNKLRAYAWVISRWRAILRKREQVQSCRVISDRALLSSTSHAIEFTQVTRTFPAHAATCLFNPLFYLLRDLTMLLVRW